MIVDSTNTPIRGTTAPEFIVDSERVIVPELSVENVKPSGLRLSRSEDIGQFYGVSGHRSLLMGHEGADFEVWVYPFKAFVNCEIGFYVDHTLIWSDEIRKTFTSTPESSIITYEIPGLKITQTIFAPINEPGIVMLFKTTTKKLVSVVARMKSDLKLMWPADQIDLEPQIGFDKGTGAWIVRSKDQKVVAMAGWEGGEAQGHLPPDVFRSGDIVMAREFRQDHLCSLVFAGSIDGFETARNKWIKLAKNPYELLQSTTQYYQDIDSEMITISTPDKNLNEAFRWAKIGLDKSYKMTPGLGAGFVAGYNLSGDGARPGFGWYFGRDSSWSQFSFNIMGQFEKSRNNMDLLAKYQITDGPDKGKIYHELSAAHDFIAEENRNYAYPAGDATPLYVIDMADYLRWTGDTDYVKANWQHVIDAIDWCYRMDIDRDKLIDNPPAGHQWYDYGEKNMIDLVAIWCRALESSAEMARVFEDDDFAEKCQLDADAVRTILNTDFWDESRGYLHDRKLPDGKMADLTTANPSVPLLWTQIEPEKADRAIDRMIQPDMTVEWGIRTNSSLDSIYNPNGYHEGTVWPLVTGWASLACFNNHRPAEGLAYLKANSDLTKDFALGYITEVVNGDSRTPSGCPHQTWSEAMVIQPTVEGLLGISVDATNRMLTISPNVPEDWTSFKVKNLKVGSNKFDISYEHKEGKMRVTIKQPEGADAYNAIVSPAFPKSTVNATTMIHGEPIAHTITKTPADVRVTVKTLIDVKLVIDFEVG